MSSLIFFTTVIVLLGFSAYFSAAETALFSLSPMTVKTYGRSRNKLPRLIADLIARPRELMVTLFICNTLTNILIQNLFSHKAGQNASWWWRVGAPLVLTLVFGEIIPKSLAFSNNERLAPLVAPAIARAKWVLRPVRSLLTTVTNWATSLLFFFLKREQELSKDELHQVLRSSLKSGVLARDEADLIDGYLTLQETSVRELMRPREDILFYNMKEPISKLIHLFVDEQCSRVPICDESLEQMRGVMTARQFLLNRQQLQSAQALPPLLQKPFFVPEATAAKTLLRQFAAKKETMAIVVDEYGSISGLITREDLVEAVVGEITDRRDQKARFTKSGEDVIIASGKLEMAEFEEFFGQALPNETNKVTIGGWLTDQMGDIPKAGTQVTLHGFYFQILAADPNRVRRVYIKRLKGTRGT